MLKRIWPTVDTASVPKFAEYEQYDLRVTIEKIEAGEQTARVTCVRQITAKFRRVGGTTSKSFRSVIELSEQSGAWLVTRVREIK